MPPKKNKNKNIEQIKQAQTKAKQDQAKAKPVKETISELRLEQIEGPLINPKNLPTINPTRGTRLRILNIDEKIKEDIAEKVKNEQDFIQQTTQRYNEAKNRREILETKMKNEGETPVLKDKKKNESKLMAYYKSQIGLAEGRLKTAMRKQSGDVDEKTTVEDEKRVSSQDLEVSDSEDEKAGAQAVIEDTSTKSKTQTKNVKIIDVQLPTKAQQQANLAGGSEQAPVSAITDQEWKDVVKTMASKAKEGPKQLEAYYKEQEPRMTEKQKQLASTFTFNAQVSMAQQANAGQNTGSQNAMCYDDNSSKPVIINPDTQPVLSKDGSAINPEIQKGDTVIMPPNPATETTKTDTGTIVGNANGRPITAEQTNLITVRDTGKKDEREMAFLQGDKEGEVIFGSSDESKSNGPQTAGGAGAGVGQMAGIGAGGGKPPDRPYKTTAFTNEQISRFIQAQNEDNMRNSMQSQIEQNLKADSEKQKTIGDRMRVGLDTYGDIPKADILVKSDNERLKSLHSFVNNRWIESIQNSKRGNLSCLKEMDDMEEKLKYSRLYTMAYNPIPVDQEDLIKKNYKFIARNISQRLTPAIDNITELSPEGRPVGALPPSLHNIGAYNYRHEGIYGTTDLGLSQNLPELLMPDYRLNSLQYPNVLYDMNNDRYRYI